MSLTSVKALQAALKKRESETQRYLLFLAEAEKNLREAIEEHQQLQKDLEKSLLRREAILSKKLDHHDEFPDMNRILVEDQFIVGLRYQIQKALHRVSVRKKKREQTRLAFLEAKKNQSVLEKVIEKRKEAVRLESARIENSNLDDIYGSLSFHRIAKSGVNS